MIVLSNKSDCCGCGACSSICPQKCIYMKEDKEGFKYPKIEVSECNNCNLCNKICPVLNKKKVTSGFKSYIAINKDLKTRLNSSSGGVFSLLAETILRQGGVVFGASFDEKFLVNHISVDTVEKIDYIRGTKYCQSDLKQTYMAIKEMLDNEKLVLFSGTPCQVEGLKHFLQKDYANLYTIDLLCHGVPSPRVWNKYLEELEMKYGSRVDKVSFRDKELGWLKYSLVIKFENGEEYKNEFKQDTFGKLFLNNICLRPSCHNCKYKNISRVSDITLGDCWGIVDTENELNDDNGTSLVIVHSENGQELFNDIRQAMAVEKVNLDDVLPKSNDARKSVNPHPNRKKFFKRIDKREKLTSTVKLTENTTLVRIKKRIANSSNNRLRQFDVK